MRWWIFGGLVLLAACASHPRGDRDAAFSDYWDCVFAAARPHIGNTQLPAREAAMRAQARCYGRYERYKAAHEAYSRSVVRPDGYEIATQVADEAVLQKRKYVTHRLTEWVAQSRR